MVATSCQVFYSNIFKKSQPALKQVPQPRSVEDFAYAVLVYGRKVDDILAWSQALREVQCDAGSMGPRRAGGCPLGLSIGTTNRPVCIMYSK